MTVVRPTARLSVVVRCPRSGVTSFSARPPMVPFVRNVRDGAGRALPCGGDVFSGSADGSALYDVDLDAAATSADDFDVALAVGRSVFAPASSFLLAPAPLDPAATVFVRVHPGGEGFVTGLDPNRDGFSFLASDVHFATYAVFGTFDQASLDVPGLDGTTANLTIATLDGPLDLPRRTWSARILRAATGIANFYGGFPLPRTLLSLVPIAGETTVVHGNVLPAGGSAVVVLAGEKTTEGALDKDWILVHELFHLGFPSFVREGSWLDEGLATYFEPIIRARLGLLNEAETWHEITVGMPRGIRLCEGAGLEHPGDDFRAIYWAGAVVALLGDVEARRRNHDGPGLEDGLRTVLRAGGNATAVWREQRALEVIDGAIGGSTFEDLAAKYREGGAPVPLDSVLTELGVERAADSVRLHDDAPLAEVRKSIVWGKRGAPGR